MRTPVHTIPSRTLDLTFFLRSLHMKIIGLTYCSLANEMYNPGELLKSQSIESRSESFDVEIDM
jgi:hypothetical protein